VLALLFPDFARGGARTLSYICCVQYAWYLASLVRSRMKRFRMFLHSMRQCPSTSELAAKWPRGYSWRFDGSFIEICQAGPEHIAQLTPPIAALLCRRAVFASRLCRAIHAGKLSHDTTSPQSYRALVHLLCAGDDFHPLDASALADDLRFQDTRAHQHLCGASPWNCMSCSRTRFGLGAERQPHCSPMCRASTKGEPGLRAVRDTHERGPRLRVHVCVRAAADGTPSSVAAEPVLALRPGSPTE
jgi:hypothetical protein